jgi:CRP/FNR family transcriptional regulator
MTPADAIARIPSLARLPDDARRRLAGSARVRRLARGETLWSEGRPGRDFTWVVEGRVKTVKASCEGRESILSTPDDGRLLCAAVPMRLAPFCCRADALDEGTWVLAVDRREVLDLAQAVPAVALALVDQLAEERQTLCRRIDEVSSLGVGRRIARLLLRLAEEVGEPVPAGERGPSAGTPRHAPGSVHIPVRLSRQDLADLCGTTVETAIREVRKMETSGVLTTTKTGFVVHDRRALEDHAS